MRSGGVERWLAELLPAFRQMGVDARIGLLDTDIGMFGEYAVSRGVPIISIGGKGSPIHHIAEVRRAIISAGGFDVVHAHLGNFSAFTCMGAQLAGVPCRVVHSHNVLNGAANSFVRRAYLQLTRSLLPIVTSNCLAPSQAALIDMMGNCDIGDRRYRVLPCGFEFSRFHSRYGRNQIRSALGLRPSALIFGNVGRLSPEKNQLFLIDILAQATRKGVDCQLVLLGEGEFRHRLTEYAEELGVAEHLCMPGVRSDLPEILADSLDVYVHCSEPPPRGTEASPIAVLEAQVARIPCVISDGVYDETIIAPSLVIRRRVSDSPLLWWNTIASQFELLSDSARMAEAQQEITFAAQQGFDLASNCDLLLSLYRAHLKSE